MYVYIYIWASSFGLKDIVDNEIGFTNSLDVSPNNPNITLTLKAKKFLRPVAIKSISECSQEVARTNPFFPSPQCSQS